MRVGFYLFKKHFCFLLKSFALSSSSFLSFLLSLSPSSHPLPVLSFFPSCSFHMSTVAMWIPMQTLASRLRASLAWVRRKKSPRPRRTPRRRARSNFLLLIPCEKERKLWHALPVESKLMIFFQTRAARCSLEWQ